eukprot:SAG11_NODE_1485_length_4822_cov_4.117298_2_plen_150_part_00
MAEELIGAEARILEHNSIINRRGAPKTSPTPAMPQDFRPGLVNCVRCRFACSEASYDPTAPAPAYGWHRGASPAAASHVHGGLLHCNFVKALTNLTPLEKDDGGTVVIAGSHRMAELTPAELVWQNGATSVAINVMGIHPGEPRVCYTP